MAHKEDTKYIFVVGGVMSGVGKGVSSSSIGVLFKAKGYKVTAVKIDPYINVDAGTMNPTIHGEVFVLNDRDETDQDMGNYERFLNEDLARTNYMTTGRIYQSVIDRERNLEFNGECVEVIPDIPEEVIRRVKKAGRDAEADIVIVEIGGTIGEYQNLIFLEAARMLRTENKDNCAITMVSYLPTPQSIGEMKTKPTQYASRTLNGVGLQADVIIGRSSQRMDDTRREKIARFCNIGKDRVISAPDADSIYDIPLNFEELGLATALEEVLSLPHKESDLSEWKEFVAKTKNGSGTIEIAVVGKYFNSGEFVLSDVYISVLEAIKTAGYYNDSKVNITYLDAEEFDIDPEKLEELNKYQGVLIPGGFGSRGIEGKIKVIQYVRENKIPYFGLCYGMQLQTIEFARNVAGFQNANTYEINPDAEHLVIDIMPEQKVLLKNSNYGGTMRLGAYPAKLKKGTIAYEAYGKEEISERHRHRYEVNPEYVEDLTKAGLVFSGTSPDGRLMEIAELPRKVHPFMVSTQFHPEFRSRPLDPHPLFVAFIRAAKENT